jgi:hypothetical protein
LSGQTDADGLSREAKVRDLYVGVVVLAGEQQILGLEISAGGLNRKQWLQYH